MYSGKLHFNHLWNLSNASFRCIYFPLLVGSSVVSWSTDKIPSEDYAKSVLFFCISFMKIINVLIIISEWYIFMFFCNFTSRWLKRLRGFCSLPGYFCYIVTRAVFHYFLRLKKTMKVKTDSQKVKTTRNYYKSNLKVCFVKKWVLTL